VDDNDNWVAAPHLQHLARTAQANGLDVEQWLLRLGRKNPPIGAEATLPISMLEELLAQLDARFPGYPFGLVMAESTQPAAFGVLGYLSQSCTRFADVLDLIVRYNGLLSSFGNSKVIYLPGRVRVDWECLAGSPLFRRHAYDYVLGSFTVLARTLLQPTPMVPLEVGFSHPPPENKETRLRLQQLFQSPIYFDQPQAGICFDRKLMDQPLSHSDLGIKTTLAQHADALMRQRQQTTTLPNTVMRLARAMFVDCPPGLEDVADQLGISGRTLHRRLDAHNTKFRSLIDEIRMERAPDLISNSHQPLEVTAFQLGFQSRQSLIRWFKRRTGLTPGEYRQRGDHKP
jgi:AraC-like DNA-binding protein